MVGVCFGRMLRVAGRVMLVSLGSVVLARRGCGTGSRRAFELPVGGKVQWIGIGGGAKSESLYLLRLGVPKDCV